MTKFTSPSQALDALKDNQDVVVAMHYLVEENVPDIHLSIRRYLQTQNYNAIQAEQLCVAIVTLFGSEQFKRIFVKFQDLELALPLSLLIILTGQSDAREQYEFKLWRMSLAQPAIFVYLMDDDPMMSRLLSFFTERTIDPLITIGSSVDFDSGVDNVLALKPDIVVIDHMMPGKSGIEAIKILRPKLPNAILVLRSWASYELSVHESALEAGADKVIPYGPIFNDDYIILLMELYEERFGG